MKKIIPLISWLLLAPAIAQEKPKVFTPGVNNPVGDSYVAPPQDQKLPYTFSGKAAGLQAIHSVIALYANVDYGSRYTFIFGNKTRLDDAQILGGAPIVRDGIVYVPTAFAGLLALKEFHPDVAPEYLKTKWVYSFARSTPALPENVRTVVENERSYIVLDDAAKAFGWNITKNERGLIRLSREVSPLPEIDAPTMDNVATLFDSPDALADPDVATANIPTLKGQGKWSDHVHASPEDLKLLAGPETKWPEVSEKTYDASSIDMRLLGSKVPAPGVYPRLLFSPEDVSMFYDRMKSQKLGQRTFVEWEVLFKKTWWDPTTSDGQIFLKLASDTDYKTLQWPKVDISPGAGVTHSIFDGQKPGIYSSHVNYNTNCLVSMALYCLLIGDETHGRQAATALVNYYRLIEPAVDEHNATSDSQWGVNTTGANNSETGWRGMHGVVAHMDLPFALDFGGKWMNPEQKDFMRRLIAKATYGRRDNMQAAPLRVRDINHMTWHLTSFLAASAIEGLEGCDPEVLQAGRESARAFCDWGIDENGQIFESNGKSGGGLQFQILTMNVLARRGLNLWGHPHWLKLLDAQVHATAPNGKATVSSGTWGGTSLSGPSVSMMKAFEPKNRAADYLLTQQYPELDATRLNADTYRAELEKSIARLRLPGPSYPAFVFSGIYNTDWQPTVRADLNLPTSFADPIYGLLSASSSNQPDAAWIYLHVRANQYIGSGHHHADVGMFYFSSGGVNWITESPFQKSYDGKYHNEVLIDSIAEPDGLPGRGTYVGANITAGGAFATADQTQSYTYKWTNQMVKWDGMSNSDVWGRNANTKGWEIAHDPLALAVYKGTQHNKSRPWWPSYNFSNWMPVLQSKWNPVEYAFRSAGLVRGKRDYGVIIDDLKKDDAPHLYQWTAMLGSGVVGVNVKGLRPGEVVLARAADVEAGQPKAGSPLLLVHRLNEGAAISETATDGEVDPKTGPQPYQRISMKLESKTANYRVLLIPAAAGEAFPEISYDDATRKARIHWPDLDDEIAFELQSNGRTHAIVRRGGKELVATP